MKNKGGSQTESHYATTDDGYILKIHRMLPKENISHNNSNVMLFFHGLFGSSGQFVIEKSSAGKCNRSGFGNFVQALKYKLNVVTISF